jgi:hypothetical protein
MVMLVDVRWKDIKVGEKWHVMKVHNEKKYKEFLTNF